MENLKHKPYFIWLFSLVFYLIQLQDYVYYVTFSKIVFDYINMTTIVLFIYFLFRKIFRNYVAEFSITYFFFLIFYFFFGNIKTALMNNGITKYVSSYQVILPLFFAIIYLIFRLLKNKPKRYIQWFQYANSLSLVLLVLQSILLINILSKPSPKIVEKINFKPITSTFKNNIYFILLDEYAGNKSLKEFFNYDNFGINEYLKQNGFYISDSILSNNNQTINSMNSILNMQYLKYENLYPYNNYNSHYLNSYKSIKNNQLTNFLYSNNYKINNLSIFDLNNANKNFNFHEQRLTTADLIIYKNIFHNKIYNDLSWILSTGKNKIWYFYKKNVLHDYYQNLEIINKTINQSYNNSENNFTYTHLLIPHDPFYTDSTGKLYEEVLYNTNQYHLLYLDYLKYANLIIKKITSEVLKNNPNSIIILMSDHGYKSYPVSKLKLTYNNFLAVRFPDSNYTEIKKVKSNVNVFRTILNQYFNQHLPMLIDSFFYIEAGKNTLTPLQNMR